MAMHRRNQNSRPDNPFSGNGGGGVSRSLGFSDPRYGAQQVKYVSKVNIAKQVGLVVFIILLLYGVISWPTAPSSPPAAERLPDLSSKKIEERSFPSKADTGKTGGGMMNTYANNKNSFGKKKESYNNGQESDEKDDVSKKSVGSEQKSLGIDKDEKDNTKNTNIPTISNTDTNADTVQKMNETGASHNDSTKTSDASDSHDKVSSLETMSRGKSSGKNSDDRANHKGKHDTDQDGNNSGDNALALPKLPDEGDEGGKGTTKSDSDEGVVAGGKPLAPPDTPGNGDDSTSDGKAVGNDKAVNDSNDRPLALPKPPDKGDEGGKGTTKSDGDEGAVSATKRRDLSSSINNEDDRGEGKVKSRIRETKAEKGIAVQKLLSGNVTGGTSKVDGNDSNETSRILRGEKNYHDSKLVIVGGDNVRESTAIKLNTFAQRSPAAKPPADEEVRSSRAVDEKNFYSTEKLNKAITDSNSSSKYQYTSPRDENIHGETPKPPRSLEESKDLRPASNSKDWVASSRKGGNETKEKLSDEAPTKLSNKNANNLEKDLFMPPLSYVDNLTVIDEGGVTKVAGNTTALRVSSTVIVTENVSNKVSMDDSSVKSNSTKVKDKVIVSASVNVTHAAVKNKKSVGQRNSTQSLGSSFTTTTLKTMNSTISSLDSTLQKASSNGNTKSSEKVDLGLRSKNERVGSISSLSANVSLNLSISLLQQKMENSTFEMPRNESSARPNLRQKGKERGLDSDEKVVTKANTSHIKPAWPTNKSSLSKSNLTLVNMSKEVSAKPESEGTKNLMSTPFLKAKDGKEHHRTSSTTKGASVFKTSASTNVKSDIASQSKSMEHQKASKLHKDDVKSKKLPTASANKTKVLPIVISSKKAIPTHDDSKKRPSKLLRKQASKIDKIK